MAMVPDDFALPPKNVNALLDALQRFARLAAKPTSGDDDLPPVALPETVRALLAAGPPCPENATPLGGRFDTVRLPAAAVSGAERLAPAACFRPAPVSAVVEGAAAADAARLAGNLREAGWKEIVFALPFVLFEDDLPEARGLCEEAARLGAVVEANTWGGIALARDAGAAWAAGPGLGVLNRLAAQAYRELGARWVTASVESDRANLEALSASCPAPLAVVAYGRPPLFVTRAEAPPGVYEDRRGTRIAPRRTASVTVYRPLEPFDWTRLRNDRLRAARWMLDFAGADDAAREAERVGRLKGRWFNYERGLF
jgi:hypothetical protein